MKYRAILRTVCAYEYEIEAASEKDAIEQAKDLFSCQSPSENLDHMYDFRFYDCEGLPVEGV